MRGFFFYLGMGLQLMGLASVGICFLGGLSQGDYTKIELFQFLGGMAIFFAGHLLRAKA